MSTDIVLYHVVFNDPPTTEYYPYCHPLSLHDALPIFPRRAASLPLALPLAGTLPLTGLSPSGAHAQSVERLRESDQPLEINANDGIEWNRNDKTYIARGNARAASGDVEVLADVLTAHYRDPGGDEEASTEKIGRAHV